MNDLETIRKRFPGISCAYRDIAGTVTTKCFGFADKEANVPVDENTAFPACSISKFITGICIMKEYEQGRIDIDKPVNLYLRSWKLLNSSGNESDAPIRSLLSHTSGIIDGEDGFYGLRRSDPYVSLIDVLDGMTSYNNRQAQENNPYGSEFEYSDAGFCVLQMLLEDIEQKPYEVIADEFVFAPLNLDNTFFASLANLSDYEQKIVMATGYDEKGQAIPGKFPQMPDLAASGLWSTPKELLIIAKEFTKAINGKSTLLRAKSALEMATPSERFPWAGLGIFMDGENRLSISGWGENGQSRLKFNYRTGEAAVVMVNQNPGVAQEESGVEWLINNISRFASESD
ncbi:MAG: beta-lactamase family protein [Clostridiales bacterium]|nr:beta-lactamase family protein [Clostridiales bacterium]